MNNIVIPQTLHCTASIPELGQLKTIINKLNRIERQNKKIFKKLDKLQHTSDNIDELCHAICYTIDELIEKDSDRDTSNTCEYCDELDINVNRKARHQKNHHK